MDREIKDILRKFKGGGVISSKKELRVLKQFASTGLVNFGFDYKHKKPEAKLTSQGEWALKL